MFSSNRNLQSLPGKVKKSMNHRKKGFLCHSEWDSYVKEAVGWQKKYIKEGEKQMSQRTRKSTHTNYTATTDWMAKCIDYVLKDESPESRWKTGWQYRYQFVWLLSSGIHCHMQIQHFMSARNHKTGGGFQELSNNIFRV